MTIKQFLFVILVIVSPLISFAKDYYNATSDLNVRSGAGAVYSVSFTLQKGDKVELLSKKGNWYKIKYLGQTGYVYSKYLSYSSSVTFKEEVTNDSTEPNFQPLLLLILVIGIVIFGIIRLSKKENYEQYPTFSQNTEYVSDEILRAVKTRRSYYNDVYLKSDAWRRKRFIVLRRDNWRCVHCGALATQVHHKRYAPKNIGKEPIEWLESVCKPCHESLHR